MQTKTKLITGGVIALAAVGIGAGIAVAGDDDANEGPETPITGAELERASAAALAHTGGGHVTETELGDEESRYEVEVTMDDGTQIDVQLDESFDVVGTKTEAPGTDDDD